MSVTETTTSNRCSARYFVDISKGNWKTFFSNAKITVLSVLPSLTQSPIPLPTPHSVCCLGALMLHCLVLRVHWASLCITPHYTPRYSLCSLCAHVCMSEKQRVKRHNCACMCKLCVSIWVQERKMLCVYNAYIICACVYAFSGSACVNQSWLMYHQRLECSFGKWGRWGDAVYLIMTLTFGFLISSLQEGGERGKNLET